jgi:hypothetical protein
MLFEKPEVEGIGGDLGGSGDGWREGNCNGRGILGLAVDGVTGTLVGNSDGIGGTRWFSSAALPVDDGTEFVLVRCVDVLGWYLALLPYLMEPVLGFGREGNDFSLFKVRLLLRPMLAVGNVSSGGVLGIGMLKEEAVEEGVFNKSNWSCSEYADLLL